MYENTGWNPLFNNQTQPNMQSMTQQSPMPGMMGMPGWNSWTADKYQQNPRAMSNDFWVPVNTLEEAKNVFVQPGQRKWIMILNTMMFAVKTVNNAGATEFQAYDFQPHVEQPAQQAPMPQQTPQPTVQYATSQDVATLEQKLQQVLDKLGELEQKSTAPKGVLNNAKPVKPISGTNA